MTRLPMMIVALLLASPVSAQLEPSNDVGLSYGHVHLNVTDMELHKKLWVEHFGGRAGPERTAHRDSAPGDADRPK